MFNDAFDHVTRPQESTLLAALSTDTSYKNSILITTAILISIAMILLATDVPAATATTYIFKPYRLENVDANTYLEPKTGSASRRTRYRCGKGL